MPILIVMGKRLRIFGTVLRARNAAEKAAATDAFVRDVVPLLADGTSRRSSTRCFPLDRGERRLRAVASDTTFGKVILDCT